MPKAGVLPERNASPEVPTGLLSPETEALLRKRNAAEFAMHAAVAAEGYLRRQ